MDVYVDKKDRVWLLDFSVFGGRTAALLFDWEELAQLGARDSTDALVLDEAADAAACVQSFAVRVGARQVVARIQARHGVRPSPLMHHGLPDDFFAGSADGPTASFEAMFAQLLAKAE